MKSEELRQAILNILDDIRSMHYLKYVNRQDYFIDLLKDMFELLKKIEEKNGNTVRK